MKVKELIKGLEGMRDDAVVEIEIYPPDGEDVIWRDFEIDRGMDGIYAGTRNYGHALLRLKVRRGNYGN